MKVKFLKEIITGIGSFFVGEVRHIEDEHIVSNWIEVGLIEPFEEKVEVAVEPFVPVEKPVEPVAPVEAVEPKVADVNEDK